MLSDTELSAALRQIEIGPSKENSIILSMLSLKDATREQLQKISDALGRQKETLISLTIIETDIGLLGNNAELFNFSEFTALQHLNLARPANCLAWFRHFLAWRAPGSVCRLD